MKSKRSVEKPKNEGPAAYVFPADDPRPGDQAELLRTLQAQGCEIHRATAPFYCNRESKEEDVRAGSDPVHIAITERDSGSSGCNSVRCSAPRVGEPVARQHPRLKYRSTQNLKTRKFPAGSYIVRMDQPYSRIADALLDYQYWAPNDPQQDVYDDTGWTMGELGNVQVVRVTDIKALSAAMERVSGEVRAPGGIDGTRLGLSDQSQR